MFGKLRKEESDDRESLVSILMEAEIMLPGQKFYIFNPGDKSITEHTVDYGQAILDLRSNHSMITIKIVDKKGLEFNIKHAASLVEDSKKMYDQLLHNYDKRKVEEKGLYLTKEDAQIARTEYITQEYESELKKYS